MGVCSSFMQTFAFASGQSKLGSYAFGFWAIGTFLSSFSLVVFTFVDAYYHVAVVLILAPAGQCCRPILCHCLSFTEFLGGIDRKRGGL